MCDFLAIMDLYTQAGQQIARLRAYPATQTLRSRVCQYLGQVGFVRPPPALCPQVDGYSGAPLGHEPTTHKTPAAEYQRRSNRRDHCEHPKDKIKTYHTPGNRWMRCAECNRRWWWNAATNKYEVDDDDAPGRVPRSQASSSRLGACSSAVRTKTTRGPPAARSSPKPPRPRTTHLPDTDCPTEPEADVSMDFVHLPTVVPTLSTSGDEYTDWSDDL